VKAEELIRRAAPRLINGELLPPSFFKYWGSTSHAGGSAADGKSTQRKSVALLIGRELRVGIAERDPDAADSMLARDETEGYATLRHQIRFIPQPKGAADPAADGPMGGKANLFLWHVEVTEATT